MKNRKAIALAADFGYQEQVKTIIKSICFHNQFIDFYILNDDFPVEWFQMMEYHLSKMDCTISNTKIFNEEIKHFKFQKPMPYPTYFRYFIPEVIHEDKVLYLDCDMIITSDLTSIFTLDISKYGVAAVRDDLLEEYDGKEDYFNSGLLLINNIFWREQGFSQRLLDYTRENQGALQYHDQDVLNDVLCDNWLELDETYNYHTGADMLYNLFQQSERQLNRRKDLPKVIHYTATKPWKYLETSIRWRDIWWEYNRLEWRDIFTRWQVNDGVDVSLKKVLQPIHRAFIFTYSDSIEGIERLAKDLPNWQFHIAAYTQISEKLKQLEMHSNIKLYPLVYRFKLNELVENSDIYLDINHGDADTQVLEQVKKLGKDILSLSTTYHGQGKQFERVTDIIDYLKNERFKEHIRKEYCEK
ncbi:glycosyltransferase family 8 protein [Streptococcus agalactiae]|uniref:glycosyltransferase family 8 protein n=1 Tax=Streptococcus agalactiae TaxID=1311 RepID=UPI0008D8F79D|nr:glycosyltransferase family 8 protein [Streptococcus agalactiae]OHX71220.1 glycosyltransferase [Streptococcus agalactiae]